MLIDVNCSFNIGILKNIFYRDLEVVGNFECKSSEGTFPFLNCKNSRG